MKKNTFLVAALLQILLVFSTNAQIPRNLYYVSKPGTAELTSGEKLDGKFYCSSPFLSSQDVLYFYSDGTSSQRKITIDQIKVISFESKTKTRVIFMYEGKNLARKLENGKIEILDTKLLRNL